MSESYLARMRKQAKLTQEEVARISGLTQSMVSRIEADPKSASIENLAKVLDVLGVDLKQVLLNPNLVSPEEFSASPDNLGSLSPVDPYLNLKRNVQRLNEFIAEKAPASAGGIEQKLLIKLHSIVQTINRKPNLYLAGRSDAGKSRFANSIIGQKILPSFYTPATRLLTIVRHTEDRPAWLKEEVVILSSDFDLNRWNDSEHIQACRLLVGSYETLHHYGTHRESVRLPEAFAAMIFVDASVLKACNIVDTPGLLNSDEDNIKADAGLHLLDILVYLSPVNGFIDAVDVAKISDCIKRLPNLESKLFNSEKLANLFIVLSHAAPHISDDEISQILTVKSRILHQHLSDYFADRWESLELEFTQEDLLSRMFPFWYESRERHKPLRSALEKTLSQTFAKYQNLSADALLQDFQAEVSKELRIHEDLYNSLQNDKENFSGLYEAACKDLPIQRKQLLEKRQEISGLIEKFKEESLEELEDILDRNLTQEKVEAFLKRKFKNRKDEAREFAFTYLLETINNRVTGSLAPTSKKLKTEIDSFLSSYERIAMSFPGGSSQQTDIPFDARGSFVAGLGAAGTLGALGAWAAALGNLGGYIAISKMVGWLSAVSVGFGWSGGAAGVSALVAALGGPITLGLAAAGVVGMAMWAVGGDSWESRLARKMMKILEEKSFRKKYRASLRKYWKESKIAFESGADQLEKSFTEHVAYLKKLSEETHVNLVELEQAIAALTNFKHALHVLWKRLSEEEKN